MSSGLENTTDQEARFHHLYVEGRKQTLIYRRQHSWYASDHGQGYCRIRSATRFRVST